MTAGKPYVTVLVASATDARTYIIQDNDSPCWAQHFLVAVAHEAVAVSFVVKDSDVFKAELIGSVAIPTERIQFGDRVEGVYPVLEPSGKPCAPGAMMWLYARLTSGVTPGRDFPGVPNNYFLPRPDTRVTLYQYTHVLSDGLPARDQAWERGHLPSRALLERCLRSYVVVGVPHEHLLQDGAAACQKGTWCWRAAARLG